MRKVLALYWIQFGVHMGDQSTVWVGIGSLWHCDPHGLDHASCIAHCASVIGPCRVSQGLMLGIGLMSGIGVSKGDHFITHMHMCKLCNYCLGTKSVPTKNLNLLTPLFLLSVASSGTGLWHFDRFDRHWASWLRCMMVWPKNSCEAGLALYKMANIV